MTKAKELIEQAVNGKDPKRLVEADVNWHMELTLYVEGNGNKPSRKDAAEAMEELIDKGLSESGGSIEVGGKGDAEIDGFRVR